MSKASKLLTRLLAKPPPKELTWDELVLALEHLGFSSESTGSGSAYRFRHKRNLSDWQIWLHKPHNRNPPTVHVCYIKDVVKRLQEWGLV